MKEQIQGQFGRKMAEQVSGLKSEEIPTFDLVRWGWTRVGSIVFVVAGVKEICDGNNELGYITLLFGGLVSGLYELGRQEIPKMYEDDAKDRLINKK